jgi:CBS domain-containing protein
VLLQVVQRGDAMPATTVRGVMKAAPVRCQTNAPVEEAARLMRDNDIGDVVVMDGSELVGILTDRDIAIRVVAEGLAPQETSVGDVCSADLVTVGPDDDVDTAVRLMREHAVRRLPVVEAGATVGVVSIGDVAMDREPQSPLAGISEAEPNE